MATGYTIPDGRDLSDIFGSGSYGSSVGYQTSDGKDLGYQFAGGGTGIVTGYTNQAGIDLGDIFGPPYHCTYTPGRYNDQSGDAYEGTVYNGWYKGHCGSISRVPLINGVALTGFYFTYYQKYSGDLLSTWDVRFEKAAPVSVLYVNGYAFSKPSGIANKYVLVGPKYKSVRNIAPNGTLTFSPAPTSYQ